MCESVRCSELSVSCSTIISCSIINKYNPVHNNHIEYFGILDIYSVLTMCIHIIAHIVCVSFNIKQIGYMLNILVMFSIYHCHSVSVILKPSFVDILHTS